MVSGNLAGAKHAFGRFVQTFLDIVGAFIVGCLVAMTPFLRNLVFQVPIR